METCLKCPVCSNAFRSTDGPLCPVQSSVCSDIICHGCVLKLTINERSSSSPHILACPICKQEGGFNTLRPIICTLLCKIISLEVPKLEDGSNPFSVIGENDRDHAISTSESLASFGGDGHSDYALRHGHDETHPLQDPGVLQIPKEIRIPNQRKRKKHSTADSPPEHIERGQSNNAHTTGGHTTSCSQTSMNETSSSVLSNHQEQTPQKIGRQIETPSHLERPESPPQQVENIPDACTPSPASSTHEAVISRCDSDVEIIDLCSDTSLDSRERGNLKKNEPEIVPPSPDAQSKEKVSKRISAGGQTVRVKITSNLIETSEDLCARPSVPLLQHTHTSQPSKADMWLDHARAPGVQVFRIRQFQKDCKSKTDPCGIKPSKWMVTKGYIGMEARALPIEIHSSKKAMLYFRTECADKMSHDIPQDHDSWKHTPVASRKTFCTGYIKFAKMKKGDIVVLQTKSKEYKNAITGRTLFYFGIVKDNDMLLRTAEEVNKEGFPSPNLFQEAPVLKCGRILLRKVQWMRIAWARHLPSQSQSKKNTEYVNWLMESGPVFWIANVSSRKTPDENSDTISELKSKAFIHASRAL